MKILTAALCWAFLCSASMAHLIDAPRLPSDFRQNRSGIEWRSLESERFRLIFEGRLEAPARETLALLEVLYAPVASGLKARPPKITIILQHAPLAANGFVTLAPRRSEFFVTPWLGPELGQNEWLAALAVHEFRHVVQFEKSRTGFARALEIVLGESGTALAMGYMLPSWYFEGDAVGIETAYSRSGRGRQPEFESQWRALLLAGQDWSYDQMLLGSFKRYRPNHYPVGYFLTTYLRRHYGADVLERAHREAMEWAFSPWAFLSTLEKLTGRSTEQMFRELSAELQRGWEKRVADVEELRDRPLALPAQGDPEEWVSYRYALRSEGQTYSLRSSLSHISQVVRLSARGDEEVRWTPSPLLQEFPPKARAGLTALSELELDARWGVQEYSRVEVRELATGKLVRVFRHGQGLLPVLDHRAERLATYAWSATGNPALVIHALSSGQELRRIELPRQDVVIGLDWSADGRELVLLLRQRPYRIAFEALDLASGARRVVAHTSQWNWAHPVVGGEYVYFQSPQSGIDNIHRIHLVTGVEERLTDDKVGAYAPHVSDRGELTYVRYSATGHAPVLYQARASYPLEAQRFEPYYQTLVAQEGEDLLGAQAPELADLPVREYRHSEGLWNPHSWLLLAPPFSPTVTAQLVSTDVMNTLSWTAGASYDLNERTPQLLSSLRWSYFYPELDVRAAFGGRRSEVKPSGKAKRFDEWEEGSGELGVSLPYVGLHGAFVQAARLRAYTQALHTTGRELPARGELASSSYLGAGIEGSWSFQRRRAPRDLLSPWGLTLAGSTLSARDTQGVGEHSFQHSAVGRFFAPGLLAHHSLYGELGSERQNLDGYHWASGLLFARGYLGRFFEERYKSSLNYLLPIAYPEWSLGRYLYLKRLSLNLFYDNLWGQRLGAEERFESIGSELWLDTHLARNALNLQWGVRYAVPRRRDEAASLSLFLNTGVGSF